MFDETCCCGTCRHHSKDDNGDWMCVNAKSDYCADWTEYNHSCEEWEER